MTDFSVKILPKSAHHERLNVGLGRKESGDFQFLGIDQIATTREGLQSKFCGLRLEEGDFPSNSKNDAKCPPERNRHPTIFRISAIAASADFFLGIVCVMFAGIAIVNFVVNPYAQYAPSWFKPLVQTSRAQKVDLIRHQVPVPEGLILGSSRVLKLEPAYLEQQTGLRFFNAGMNYGKTEDFLAFLRYYQDTYSRAPKMIVVGLDVNAFTNGSPPDSRLLSNPALASRIPEAIRFGDRLHRWRELLSWQQTKMSLKSVKLQKISGGLPEPVESFRDDGVIVYHQREQERAAGRYDFCLGDGLQQN